MSDSLNCLRAEVVFGPGSVIYGSDAIGGVVDFHTLEPDFSPDGFNINGKTLTRLSSVNEEKTGNIQLEMAGKNVASSISYSYSDYGHLVTGNERNSKFPDFGKRASYVLRINGQDSIVKNPDPNRQIFSGYNQHNFQGKLRAKISNNLRFDYGFYYSTSSNIPRYDRLIETRNGDYVLQITSSIDSIIESYSVHYDQNPVCCKTSDHWTSASQLTFLYKYLPGSF